MNEGLLAVGAVFCASEHGPRRTSALVGVVAGVSSVIVVMLVVTSAWRSTWVPR